jgi:hypothetical protein
VIVVDLGKEVGPSRYRGQWEVDSEVIGCLISRCTRYDRCLSSAGVGRRAHATERERESKMMATNPLLQGLVILRGDHARMSRVRWSGHSRVHPEGNCGRELCWAPRDAAWRRKQSRLAAIVSMDAIGMGCDEGVEVGKRRGLINNDAGCEFGRCAIGCQRESCATVGGFEYIIDQIRDGKRCWWLRRPSIATIRDDEVNKDREKSFELRGSNEVRIDEFCRCACVRRATLYHVVSSRGSWRRKRQCPLPECQCSGR